MENKLQKQESQLTLISSTSSLMQCLKTNKPQDQVSLIEYQSSLTLPKAVEGLQISKLKAESKSELVQALNNLVFNTSKSLNITNTLNEIQILEISMMVIEKYWFLKLDELVLIFKKAKTGEFGKMYNRLDIQIICEWIETYLKSEERAVYFEKKNTEHKKKEIDVKLMPQLYEKYKMEKEPEENKDEEYQRQRAEYFRQKQINEGLNDKRK